MGKVTEADEPLAEINVVPLVDVILVVLIIFMVTAPLFMKPAINVNLPKAASGEQTAPSKLSLSIDIKGQLYLNGAVSSEEEIKSKVTAELAKNPDVQAVISADQEVAHGKVVKIIDLVKGLGVKKFAISTDKK